MGQSVPNTNFSLGGFDLVFSQANTTQALSTMGVNFVDTARECRGSEYLIGRVMRAGKLAVN